MMISMATLTHSVPQQKTNQTFTNANTSECWRTIRLEKSLTMEKATELLLDIKETTMKLTGVSKDVSSVPLRWTYDSQRDRPFPLTQNLLILSMGRIDLIYRGEGEAARLIIYASNPAAYEITGKLINSLKPTDFKHVIQ